MSKLIIAEKPSVAKSIASALGASSRADGFYEGSGLLVSWCVGHLVSPMDAGGYDENFKKWRYDDLPILPEPFRYVLAPGKEDAFENLRVLRADAKTQVSIQNHYSNIFAACKEKPVLCGKKIFCAPRRCLCNLPRRIGALHLARGVL